MNGQWTGHETRLRFWNCWLDNYFSFIHDARLESEIYSSLFCDFYIINEAFEVFILWYN